MGSGSMNRILYLILVSASGQMLQGCWQSPPSPENMRAACDTLPPIQSRLKPLYALDTDGDGIVFLDVDKRDKSGLLLNIINPVTKIPVKEIGDTIVNGITYKLQIVDFELNKPDDIGHNYSKPIGSRLDDIYIGEGYVGRGYNLIYHYRGFSSPSSADCIHSFPVRVQLIKEVN